MVQRASKLFEKSKMKLKERSCLDIILFKKLRICVALECGLDDIVEIEN